MCVYTRVRMHTCLHEHVFACIYSQLHVLCCTHWPGGGVCVPKKCPRELGTCCCRDSPPGLYCRRYFLISSLQPNMHANPNKTKFKKSTRRSAVLFIKQHRETTQALGVTTGEGGILTACFQAIPSPPSSLPSTSLRLPMVERIIQRLAERL